MDAAKVANTILFVTSVTNEINDTKREAIDDWGKEIIISCLAQGLPATIFAVHNIKKLHVKVSSVCLDLKRILNYSVNSISINL